MDKEKRSC